MALSAVPDSWDLDPQKWFPLCGIDHPLSGSFYVGSGAAKAVPFSWDRITLKWFLLGGTEHLLETVVLNELKVWQNVSRCGGTLYFFRSNSDVEIDFIWERGATTIAFEIKSLKRWDSRYAKTLKRFKNNGLIKHAYGIYLGENDLQDEDILVLSWRSFVKRLHLGELIPV